MSPARERTIQPSSWPARTVAECHDWMFFSRACERNPAALWAGIGLPGRAKSSRARKIQPGCGRLGRPRRAGWDVVFPPNPDKTLHFSSYLTRRLRKNSQAGAGQPSGCEKSSRAPGRMSGRCEKESSRARGSPAVCEKSSHEAGNFAGCEKEIRPSCWPAIVANGSPADA